MENLRVTMERDLGDCLESEFKMPVELTSPDGETQIYSVNNPLEKLGGQVLYFSRRENPETGETIVINQPVVTLRISSLSRVPIPGERWFIAMPIDPTIGALWRQFIFTPDRAPEHGTDIGFIKIYPQRIEQETNPEPVS